MQQAHYPRIISLDVGGPAPNGDYVGMGPTPAASFGYDVRVNIVRATGLPSADLVTRLSDPYLTVATRTPEGVEIKYRTQTVWGDLNPQYDEYFKLGNLPPGSTLTAQAWDKDLVTPDEDLGQASWVFDPQGPQAGQQWHEQWQQEQQPAPTSGRLHLALQLQRRACSKPQGQLELEVHFQPSPSPGQPRMLGPPRFRQHLSPRAGFIMRNWNDDATVAYSTFKVFLLGIPAIFQGVRQPWNRAYDKAVSLFNSALMLGAVRTQHASLYATQLGQCRMGELRDAAEFFALLHNGVRGGQRRYFTYSLLADSLRCSETGAKFATDFMSKHAMHAAGAEEVLYAGEFCIVPDAAAPGGHRLVIDNNSGTYAPKDEHLPLMAQLFAANFPGMHVLTLAAGDPRLKVYHQLCPSRTAANQG